MNAKPSAKGRRRAPAEPAHRPSPEGPYETEPTERGARPAGRTDESHWLPRLARAAIAQQGFAPRFEASSTDANIAMSLGIPAIKIGSGGTGGRAHSPDEWIDVEPEASLRGMQAGLAVVLAAAEVV